MSKTSLSKYRFIPYVLGLAIILVLIYIAIKHQSNEVNQITNTHELLKVDQAAITVIASDGKESFSIVRDAETLTSDKLWVVAQNPNIRLDNAKVQKLILEASLITADVVETNPDDLEKYGLNTDRSFTITLDDGAVHKFRIGSKTPIGVSYYFMEDGGDTVYTIASSKAELFMSPLKDFRNKNLYSVDPEKLVNIKITRSNKDTLELNRTYADGSFGDWTLAKQNTTCNETLVQTKVIDKLTSVYVADFVDDEPQDLASYSLNNPRYILEFKENDNESEQIVIGATTENGCYVKISDSPCVYMVSIDALAFLDIDSDALHAKEAYSQSMSNISSIEIADKLNINTLKISYNDNKYTFSINETKIDEIKFMKIYDKIMSIPIEGEVSSSVDGDVEATFTINFNGNKAPDILKFIPYNATNYAMSLNDKSIHFVQKNYISDILQKTMELQAGI